MFVILCETMTVEIYNSLTRKKEPFTSVEDGKVKMYVCGMTVYSDAHIGHARTYFAFDMIRRYLQYKGYNVTYVQNVTDVDDKIIAAAQKQRMDALEYSCGFTDRCLTDLDRLGIGRADMYPKASETITDMIEMIQSIIDKGYGYEAEGDVYFSVERFPSYGRLSGQNIEELMSGARIDPGEKKRSPLDFALWKQAKPDEPSWESPWGRGRPGWHIECSAMSSKFLGLPFDIHGGGMDLRFPHHENEIAQAEAATGKPFARFWMHVGLLTVNGEKMSKSLGNMINIKDLLQKWDAETIRFFFAQTHYRRPPDFTELGLENAKKGLDRIHRFVDRLVLYTNEDACILEDGSLSSDDRSLLVLVDSFKRSFESAMDDDFNSPVAIAALFEFVSQMNKHMEQHPQPNPVVIRNAIDTVKRLGQVLTILKDDEQKEIDATIISSLKDLVKEYKPDTVVCDDADVLLDILLSIRDDARKNKQWDIADSIRDRICCLGFEIEDSAQGARWRKIV
ncbi:MAG: cysteine--tRNA ligase [Candidatus Thermoplasmatota archaeon]|nr:cysteine--tRNA ligase [Candidatus Thermoplasmatota archaeon]